MAGRRQFLKQAVIGSAVAGGVPLLPRGIGHVALAETDLAKGTVRFSDGMEPIVRLMEDTPRNRLLEEVASRIKQGTISYREVVAGLMLAGIRNVQPRPHVGFKFHTVLVVNSAHLASINSPADERWLPIFWALDYFKRTQAQDAAEGDWTMPTVRHDQLPPFHQARQEFVDAMDTWDAERADAAVASLARGASENQLFELMSHYGSRDFRDIGHKAIFVANAFRTLNCIGWQHAEPILRSLTYALQCRGSDPNPAKHDLAPDRPERDNEELARRVRKTWQEGTVNAQVTGSLVEVFHDSSPEQAAAAVVEQLNRGIHPTSILDALYLSAGEMLMRRPNIISLHAMTMTNALGYAFRRAKPPDLRLRILLQNASFLAMFLERLRGDSRLSDKRVGHIEPAESNLSPGELVADILANIGEDNDQAASQALGLVERDPVAARQLVGAARRMVFLKGTNSHDYKYSSAVLEDYHHISPAWRNRYLASTVYKLRGSTEPDTPLLPRIRQALS